MIGGGYSGLAAARRLAETVPSDRIVVLEALRIGDGPAGRSSGFMIDLPHKLDSDSYTGSVEADRRQTIRNRLAIDFVRRVIDEDGLDPAIQYRTGKVNAAATEHGDTLLAAYRNHLDALSEPYETLGADEMLALTGSRYYRSGILTPQSALLHPAAYLCDLAEALSRRGVVIHENSAVTQFTEGPPHVVRTEHGQLTVPKVILAVNGAVAAFGHFKRRLMDVFTFASLTRALTEEETKSLGGEPFWGVLPADPMGTTLRRLSGPVYGGTRVLVRNRFILGSKGSAFEGRPINVITRQQRESFDNRYPALAHVPMDYVWGGRLCLSKNGATAFGEVAPGVFSAACQNGLGSVNGTLHGLLAADMATRRNCHAGLIAELTAADPPVRIPPEPITRRVGNWVIRRRETRAGMER
ncbi:MAG: FAD-binding oxidoreductase [Rhodobacter sp.]|nr:FAD-binding oxidoreductase [Rhodobacter sp.]